MQKKIPYIKLFILGLSLSLAICEISIEEIKKIQELNKIDFSTFNQEQCNEAIELKEEIANALEQLNLIEIDKYASLSNQLPRLIETAGSMKKKQEEAVKNKQRALLDKLNTDTLKKEQEIDKASFENNQEEQQNKLKELEKKLDKINEERSAKMKTNFEKMTKPKDQWLEENGISNNEINTMDQEITENLELDIEEALKQEYGDFVESEQEIQEIPNNNQEIENLEQVSEMNEYPQDTEIESSQQQGPQINENLVPQPSQVSMEQNTNELVEINQHSFFSDFQQWINVEEKEVVSWKLNKRKRILRKEQKVMENSFRRNFDNWIKKENLQVKNKNEKFSHQPVKQQFLQIFKNLSQLGEDIENTKESNQLITKLALLETKLTEFKQNIQSIFDVYEQKGELEDKLSQVTKFVSTC